MTVGVGTWRWMAPEVFESGFYDEKADVFSFAIVMYEVLARSIPYCEKFPLEATDPRIAIQVCNGLRPQIDVIQGCPPVLRTLVEQCWDTEAQKRPDFELIERQLCEVLAALVAASEP